MLCLMHEGSPYGYLKVGHKVIHPATLARMVGATLPEVEGWLDELESAGVFSRDENGCIYSRRMIRDEEVRAARAAGGAKGGNPALKKTKVNLADVVEVGNKVNLPGNLQPTPASASAFASADNYLTPPNGHASEGLPPLPDIPASPVEWLKFFERMGFQRPHIQTAENMTRFSDWCRRKVPLATALIGVEAAEAKLGRKPDKPKYYLGFIEEAITAADRLNSDIQRKEKSNGQPGRRKLSPTEAIRIAREQRGPHGGVVIDTGPAEMDGSVF